MSGSEGEKVAVPEGNRGERKEERERSLAEEGGAAADEQVDEVVEESFPASDPPPGPRAPGASR